MHELNFSKAVCFCYEDIKTQRNGADTEERKATRRSQSNRTVMNDGAVLRNNPLTTSISGFYHLLQSYNYLFTYLILSPLPYHNSTTVVAIGAPS